MISIVEFEDRLMTYVELLGLPLYKHREAMVVIHGITPRLYKLFLEQAREAKRERPAREFQQ